MPRVKAGMDAEVALRVSQAGRPGTKGPAGIMRCEMEYSRPNPGTRENGPLKQKPEGDATLASPSGHCPRLRTRTLERTE